MPHHDHNIVQVVTAGDIQSENDPEGNKSSDPDNKSYTNDEQENKTFFSRFGGMLMALSASFCFSLSFLIMKILANHGFKAFGSAVLFNAGVLLPCLLGILYHEKGPGSKGRLRIFKEIWPLNSAHKKKTMIILTIQGILQGLSVILRSCSLRYLSVGDMTVIVFSSPVVTNFIAHFLVGEKCGLFFVFTALFTLGGVALITKPPILSGATSFDYNTSVGSSLAVAAMLCLSMKFAVTRKIKEAHCLLMTLFLGGCGLLISLPLYLIFEDWSSIEPKVLNDALLVAGLITGFFSILCINLALKKEDAGPVALIRSCDVIFAFVFQYLFLGVIPDILSTIGAIVVVSGVLLTGVRKWLMARPIDSESQSKGNGRSCFQLSQLGCKK